MKIVHTADWHLGKLIQGIYLTDDQRYVLEQLIEDIRQEQPDVLIIAGDIYDRSVPPTEAVDLLDDILNQLVLDLHIPVLAIAGNHDSPDRLQFASKLMTTSGLHIVGQLTEQIEPVILHDDFGEVHFYLVPYADPARVRHIFQDEAIKTHDDAMKAIVTKIKQNMQPDARYVFVGHAFVTPYGEQADNTSDAERPLAIGGAEYVKATYFEEFHYTALGHLHQAHQVGQPHIRYAGSPLKYSISEEHHQKGYYLVHLDQQGKVEVEKKVLTPRRNLRTVEGLLAELLQNEVDEDYVFVRLLDPGPILFPMEKVRSVYPNALHVERKVQQISNSANSNREDQQARYKLDPLTLFTSFFKEVHQEEAGLEKEELFSQVLQELVQKEVESV